ncbi:MAG: plasmid stabilization protein [Pseudomonadota bacterium]
MASLTIRNLDDEVKQKLRERAARNGRSMEEEARATLRRSVEEDAHSSTNLRPSIHAAIAKIQARYRDLDPEGKRSPVDELIAERRAEAAAEDD